MGLRVDECVTDVPRFSPSREIADPFGGYYLQKGLFNGFQSKYLHALLQEKVDEYNES
jgi:hypothetical protein